MKADFSSLYALDTWLYQQGYGKMVNGDITPVSSNIIYNHCVGRRSLMVVNKFGQMLQISKSETGYLVESVLKSTKRRKEKAVDIYKQQRKYDNRTQVHSNGLNLGADATFDSRSEWLYETRQRSK